MDPMYIKPFVSSIQNVFSTMMQLQVTVKEPYVKPAGGPNHDVSGIIGLSGDVVGSVVLAFPQATAQNIVNLFTGQQIPYGTPDFADAVGELVNMITGNAKALFKEKKASISCPSVIVGGNHRVAQQSDTACICIPCSTDCGDVTIEIAIKPSPSANLNAAKAAVASAR
jgi:chemotaxis protein CheX